MNISSNERPKKARPSHQSNHTSLRKNWLQILIFMVAVIGLYLLIAWSGKKTESANRDVPKSSSDSQQTKTAESTAQKTQQANQGNAPRVVEMTGVLLTAYQKFSHLLNSDIKDKYGNTYTIRNMIIRSFREYTYCKKTRPVYSQWQAIRILRALRIFKAHAAGRERQCPAGCQERASRPTVLRRRR